MKKVWKRLLAGILLAGFLAGVVLTAQAKGAGEQVDHSLQSGTMTDATEFQSKIALNQKNGKYIDFGVENQGAVSLKISINEEASVTLAPGETGTLRIEAKNILWLFSRDYTFKAVPTPNGGKISLYFSITQCSE